MPLIILGAGGHAKVLIDTLQSSSAVIKGVVDPNPALIGSSIFDVPVLGGDDIVSKFHPSQIQLVNGVGSIGMPVLRQHLYLNFKELGYTFAKVIHQSAVVASDVVLGEGTQIMAGAVIQPGTRIGCNVVINTKSSVDHDCTIDDHTHLSPGVTLSGGVTIGSSSHIGTGATIIQGITIGSDCLVAAGAVVTKNILNSRKVRGIPAREFV